MAASVQLAHWARRWRVVLRMGDLTTFSAGIGVITRSDQISRANGALRDLLNLERCSQADASGAPKPVVHLPSADRRCQPLAERGMGELVLLKVVSELH